MFFLGAGFAGADFKLAWDADFVVLLTAVFATLVLLTLLMTMPIK